MHRFSTVPPKTIRPDRVALALAPRRTVQYACGAFGRAPCQVGPFVTS